MDNPIEFVQYCLINEKDQRAKERKARKLVMDYIRSVVFDKSKDNTNVWNKNYTILGNKLDRYDHSFMRSCLYLGCKPTWTRLMNVVKFLEENK